MKLRSHLLYIFALVGFLFISLAMLDHQDRQMTALVGEVIQLRMDTRYQGDLWRDELARAENCYYRLSQCLADEFVDEVIAGREPLHTQLWTEEK